MASHPAALQGIRKLFQFNLIKLNKIKFSEYLEDVSMNIKKTCLVILNSNKAITSRLTCRDVNCWRHDHRSRIQGYVSTISVSMAHKQASLKPRGVRRITTDLVGEGKLRQRVPNYIPCLKQPFQKHFNEDGFRFCYPIYCPWQHCQTGRNITETNVWNRGVMHTVIHSLMIYGESYKWDLLPSSSCLFIWLVFYTALKNISFILSPTS